MDIDRTIRWATGLTVAVVAGIAAWISYQHIKHVGHSGLLPISVDGMIITSSLVLLAANRANLETIWLARVTLWLGIAATLAANVLFGLPSGIEWAVISAWPAVCFIMAVETLMQLAKARRKRRVRPVPVRMAGSAAMANTVTAEPKDTGPVYAKATVDRMAREGVTNPKDLRKVPSIREIRAELGCGQPIATEVQGIMRTYSMTDIRKALAKREEMKHGDSH